MAGELLSAKNGFGKACETPNLNPLMGQDRSYSDPDAGASEHARCRHPPGLALRRPIFASPLPWPTAA